jgi:hypothetical protein
MVMAEPGGIRVHAALNHGHFGVKLHRSEDGGRHWQEVETPRYPEPPPDEEDLDPMRGEPVPWALKTIWSLEGGHHRAPDRIWCGTMPGGLFRSDDGGNSWSMLRSLWDDPRRKLWFGGGADWPGVHSILVHPENPERITVAVSCGGVWTSANGGCSWKLVGDGLYSVYMPNERRYELETQDTHRLVMCPAQPEVVWAQHHNGVFKSTDGGCSWADIRDIKPSTFGFAVAVHPRDPDIAWFVPALKDEQRYPVDAKVVVTRTRDGGSSFETLSQGLPQRHSYDIVYRHALDVDDSGEVLAMGSTTGSLWLSEDQGNTWTTLSNHLPPIHCVRFVPVD